MSRYRGSERFCRYTVSPLRKRKFQPGVEGEGTLVARPADFTGNDFLNATGIRIDSIEFDTPTTGREAPTAFKCWANISVAGSRRDSGLGFSDPEIHQKWELVFEDDSAVPYGTDLTHPRTDEVLNPNVDDGNVVKFDVFRKGNYKVKVSAYVMTSTGQCLMDEMESETLSIADYSGLRYYFDAVNGNAANDGRDPLGAALTNATYTESTRTLTETGKFAGIVLDDETLYPYNSNRWLYLNEYGYVPVESIPNDDTCIIAEGYELGEDLTGITSSTGPRTDAEFAPLQLYNFNGSPRMYFLAGDETYAKTQSLYIRTINHKAGVIGYSGKPTITLPGGGKIIECYASSGNQVFPQDLNISNVIIDGDEVAQCFDLNLGSSSSYQTRIIFDRIVLKRSKSQTGLGIQQTGGVKDIIFYTFACELENLRTNNAVYTVESAISGNSYIDINEAVDDFVSPKPFLEITDGTNTSYHHVSSIVGNRFNLEGGRENDVVGTLPRTYPAGSTVKVGDKKGMVVAVFKVGSVGVKGGTLLGDCDYPTYDHNMYPSLLGDKNYICYVKSKAGGERTGFMFNYNNDTGLNIEGHNISYNHVETGATNFFCDASNGQNSASNGTYTNIRWVGNSGAPRSGAIFGYTAITYFAKYNEFWNASGVDRAVIQVNEGGTNANWPDYDWDWVEQDTKAYGYTAARTATSNEAPPLGEKYQQGKLDYRNNEIYSLSTNVITDIGRLLEFVTSPPIYTGNKLFYPNRSGSPITLDNVNVSLATFNTDVSGSNTNENPNWNDPANGDFSTSSGAPELILGGGTKYAVMTGFNQSSTNDKVGGSDDFDFSYTFKFLDAPNFTPLFAPSSGTNLLRLTNTTTIRWADNTGSLDFTVPEMVIGQEYEHIWRRRSGVLSLEHNGVVNASTPTTNAILNWSRMASSTSTPATQRVVMKNVSLTRLATPWTIGYNIDGGQVPTPPATSVTVAADVSTGTTDSHSITYHNIDEEDWV